MIATAFYVSVIIPVHNAAPFLHRAISSVQSQDEVLEIIIVNDCSTDNSGQIIKDIASSDQRIKLFEIQARQPQGASAARNIALSKAKAPFIAFLDADDYYLINRFKSTADFFTDNSLDAVIEGVKLCNYVNDEEYCFEPVGESSDQLILDYFRDNNRGPHLNGLTVQRRVFEKLKFDEDLYFDQDNLFFIQLFLFFVVKAGADGNIVSSYILHGGNGVFKHENRKKTYQKLGQKILPLISPKQSDAVRFYMYKTVLKRYGSQRSNCRIVRYFYYVTVSFQILYKHPILFPVTFLRAYVFDKGQP